MPALGAEEVDAVEAVGEALRLPAQVAAAGPLAGLATRRGPERPADARERAELGDTRLAIVLRPAQPVVRA